MSTAFEQLYDHRWAKASRNFRKANPLCAWCLACGDPVSAQCVDHVRPHHGRVDLFWDQSNWQSLCNGCHAAKTRLDQTGKVIDWEPRPGLVVIVGVLPDYVVHVTMPTLRMLRANLLKIEALLRMRGTCVIGMPGLFDGYEVARQLRAKLVLAKCGDREPWSIDHPSRVGDRRATPPQGTAPPRGAVCAAKVLETAPPVFRGHTETRSDSR